MKKTMLILTALFAFTVNANEVKVGKSLQDSPENIAPAFHNTPKESGLAPLNYVNQPPMVPHATKNYQVTKNINQCLTCHSPEASRVTGATRISPTHFMDRDGNIVGGHLTSPLLLFTMPCLSI